MTDQELEQLKCGQAIEHIDSIPAAEYYEAWIKMLEERKDAMGVALHPAWSDRTLRQMVEIMLLHDVPFENSVLALAPEAHRNKIAEALRWKKEQLKSRATIFGNAN